MARGIEVLWDGGGTSSIDRPAIRRVAAGAAALDQREAEDGLRLVEFDTAGWQVGGRQTAPRAGTTGLGGLLLWGQKPLHFWSTPRI